MDRDYNRCEQPVVGKGAKLTQIGTHQGLRNSLILLFYRSMARETMINGGPLHALRPLLRMQGMRLLRRRVLHAQMERQ